MERGSAAHGSVDLVRVVRFKPRFTVPTLDRVIKKCDKPTLQVGNISIKLFKIFIRHIEKWLIHERVQMNIFRSHYTHPFQYFYLFRLSLGTAFVFLRESISLIFLNFGNEYWVRYLRYHKRLRFQSNPDCQNDLLFEFNDLRSLCTNARAEPINHVQYNIFVTEIAQIRPNVRTKDRVKCTF